MVLLGGEEGRDVGGVTNVAVGVELSLKTFFFSAGLSQLESGKLLTLALHWSG